MDIVVIFSSMLFPFQIIRDSYEILRYVFLIFPQFCLGDGMVTMSYNQMMTNVYARFDIDKYTSPFTFEMIGWHLVSLGIQGIFYFILVLMLEINTCSRSRQVLVLQATHIVSWMHPDLAKLWRGCPDLTKTCRISRFSFNMKGVSRFGQNMEGVSRFGQTPEGIYSFWT